MRPEDLRDLNKLRKKGYKKNESDEGFLKRINLTLQKDEVEYYFNREPEYPYIFVFGLPRSGTTMMAQLLIQSFDLGYINNFMARFWLAPVTGIRLSKIILGDKQETELKSEYAATKNIYDLHEFGYFWRHWLKIHSTTDSIQLKEREKQTDWKGIRNVLATMQQEFGKAMCMKNIFGAYHLPEFTEVLPKSVWVYIERNPFDVAVSILNARKKFYSDLSLWWSSVPLEYPKIKDLNYIEQIAGQVYYLQKFYNEQLSSVDARHVFRVSYEDLCENPSAYMSRLQMKTENDLGYKLKAKDFPGKFQYRHYEPDTEEKEKLSEALKKYGLL